jgi:hypothetical protein
MRLVIKSTIYFPEKLFTSTLIVDNRPLFRGNGFVFQKHGSVRYLLMQLSFLLVGGLME